MQRNKLTISVSMSLLLILLASFLYLFTFHTISTVFFQATVDQTMESLEVIRDLGIHLVEDNIKQLKSKLEETALQYKEELVGGTDKEKSDILAQIPLPQDGMNYWLAESDGGVLDSDGNKLNWREELDLEEAFAGNGTTVIDPYFNKEGEYILSIAVPLYENNQVAALLLVRLDGFCISRWIGNIQFQTGSGVSYIITSSGTNIAASREENYDWITTRYNSLELADSDEASKTVAEVERLALEGKSGRGSYLWEGSRNYLVYGPMESLGWGFYAGFYGDLIKEYINKSAQKSIISSLPLSLAVLTFFIFIVAYTNYNLKKEKSYVKKLIIQKQEIQKQAQDLQVNEERFRVALAQTSNIIFEYDLLTGTITNFYATKMRTHNLDSIEELKDHIILNGTVDEESIVRLEQMLNDTRKGIFDQECTIKATCPNNSILWYKVSISPLSEQKTRVIGILEDITKEKLAELDPLTGLLNKKVIAEQISIRLREITSSTVCALMMFDIDNFKDINDIYGHPVGDQVIIQTSHILKNAFSQNVLAGRVGGDEFCIFCSDVSVPQLKNALKIIYYQAGKMENGISVTYSCGIVVCSDVKEKTFQELYQKADNALYKAKVHGKNQYYFYEKTEEI